LKGVREAVDLDQFAEYVIDTYQYIQDEREQSIKDMYLAVDVTLPTLLNLQVNNDGMLSLNEFTMLMKVTHYKTSQEIIRLFEEYAEAD
jgi:hypothetical protein